MRKVLLVLAIVFSSLTIFGQEKSIEASVFFEKDKFALTENAKDILDALLNKIDTLEITYIKLSGNTDSDASQSYNIELSKNRCLSVKEYLKTNGVSNYEFRINEYGEDKPIYTNANKIGMQKNRRVDIYIEYHTSPNVIVEEVDSLNSDPCSEDTTIMMPSGSMLVFNKCEYLEKADCFEIKEFFDPTALSENSLTTIDDEGNPLASGGMFGFPLKNNRCSNLCFPTPVIIRFAVGKNCLPCSRPSLYNIGDDGNWSKGEDLKLVLINGVYYYEIELICLDQMINNDCKIPTVNVKFKVNRKYEILYVKLSDTCPLYAYALGPEIDKRQNVLKFNKKDTYGLPCFVKDGNFEAVLIDKKTKDTLSVEVQPLENIKKKHVFSRCRVRTDKIFWFIYKKKKLARKYKIKSKDLKKINKNT